MGRQGSEVGQGSVNTAVSLEETTAADSKSGNQRDGSAASESGQSHSELEGLWGGTNAPEVGQSAPSRGVECAKKPSGGCCVMKSVRELQGLLAWTVGVTILLTIP